MLLWRYWIKRIEVRAASVLKPINMIVHNCETCLKQCFFSNKCFRPNEAHYVYVCVIIGGLAFDFVQTNSRAYFIHWLNNNCATCLAHLLLACWRVLDGLTRHNALNTFTYIKPAVTCSEGRRDLVTKPPLTNDIYWFIDWLHIKCFIGKTFSCQDIWYDTKHVLPFNWICEIQKLGVYFFKKCIFLITHKLYLITRCTGAGY